jgi:hypothetical protein
MYGKCVKQHTELKQYPPAVLAKKAEMDAKIDAVLASKQIIFKS